MNFTYKENKMKTLKFEVQQLLAAAMGVSKVAADDVITARSAIDLQNVMESRGPFYMAYDTSDSVVSAVDEWLQVLKLREYALGMFAEDSANVDAIDGMLERVEASFYMEEGA